MVKLYMSIEWPISRKQYKVVTGADLYEKKKTQETPTEAKGGGNNIFELKGCTSTALCDPGQIGSSRAKREECSFFKQRVERPDVRPWALRIAKMEVVGGDEVALQDQIESLLGYEYGDSGTTEPWGGLILTLINKIKIY
jgi:hypothetical protein